MPPDLIVPRARGTMILMLILGVLLAGGHHAFYKIHDGKPPSKATYSIGGIFTSLTSQQINLAAGAALAFLVKASLGIAIAKSAEQATWCSIRTKTLKLATIDKLSTSTTNILSLFDIQSWRGSWTTMIPALIYWLLPITSFITPATLTVEWVEVPDTFIERVPRVDFTSLNFANLPEQQGVLETFSYSNPQYSVIQAVAGSTAGGNILPIPSQHQNATWLLEFPGPALSCESLDKSLALYSNISNNILTAMVAGGNQNDLGTCQRNFRYISWVTTVDSGTADTLNQLPFPNITSSNDTYAPPSDTLGPKTDANATATNALSLYIAALPGGNDTYFVQKCGLQDGTWAQPALDLLANMAVAKCTLHNISYTTNFTYINGAQSINVTTHGLYNYVTGVDDVTGAYPLISGINQGSPIYNVQLVENIAYQAVMDVFGSMFVGTITITSRGNSEIIDTKMAATPLLRTEEFIFLQNSLSDTGNSLLGAADEGLWNGLSVQPLQNSTLSMNSVVSEMFKNATISLMSSSLLQPNYSSLYAPVGTNVTTTPYVIIYSYAAAILWIAYSVAIGVTLLSIIPGLISVERNGGSYLTNFSTILRVAYCINLSAPLQPEDTEGKDPSPRSIKDLLVLFPTENKGSYRKVAHDGHDEAS